MLCWPRCKNTGHTDLIDTLNSSGSCHHGNAGVTSTYGVSVCIHCVVPAQLGPAAAAVCHQEETKDGGNIQAQRRGEETNRSSGIRKTWPAFTTAQRRAPHMIERVEVASHTFHPHVTM